MKRIDRNSLTDVLLLSDITFIAYFEGKNSMLGQNIL